MKERIETNKTERPLDTARGSDHNRGEAGSRPDSRRWASLLVISLAQLMVALDATIMSIALPSAQAALHASDAQRQWVITAYTLAFAGLLLLGGRVADYLGRKRALIVGLTGFATASALGGTAQAFLVLVGARALQGAFGAIVVPTALSLLAVTFTEPRERGKAFGVYGGIAGSGGALGLLLGGALTQFVDWRLCLYVNVLIAAVAVSSGWIVLRDTRTASRPRFDIPGAALATAALAALVYALSQSVSDGWAAPTVVGTLAASILLLALFALRESRAAAPLLPPRIVLNRSRGGAYLSAGLAIAGMFGVFLLLTYYFQVVLRYSPLQAGLAFLPMSAVLLASSWGIASRMLPLVPPRALMVPGLLAAAAGMAFLTQIQVDSSYLISILPAEILLGVGMGCAMVPAISAGTQGVEPRDTGIASATVNTAQQVGASLGTALLNTVAAGATSGYLASAQRSTPIMTSAMVHGYSVAAGWGAGALLLAAILAGVLVDAGNPAKHGEEASNKQGAPEPTALRRGARLTR